MQAEIVNIRSSLASLIAPRPDIQDLARSIRDASEANQLRQAENWEQLVTFRTKEKVRETNERYARRYQYKNYRVQKWLAFGTWGAFVAAGVYAGFAAVTWREVQRQTKAVECASVAATQSVYVATAGLQQNQRQFEESLKQAQSQFSKTLQQMGVQSASQKKSADAARGTLRAGGEQFIIEERPYVTLGTVKFGNDKTTGYQTLEFIFDNSGKTPALEFEFDADMRIGGLSIGKTQNGISKTVIAPGKGQPFSDLFSFSSEGQAKIDRDESLIVRGIAGYDDVFKRHHSTRFCVEYRKSWGQFLWCEGESGNILDH